MRRFFGICLLCLLGATAISACAPEQGKKEIGLQLYSLRQEISQDLDATLHAVAHAGYSFVEMAHYNPAEGTFYNMTPQDFKAYCNEIGLNVLASHINGPDPNTTPMEECLAWWEKAIAHHAAAGVKYLVQPSMHRTAYQSVEGLDAYCRLFDAVGALCKAAGIQFGYHNHSGEFTTVFDGVRVYDYMLTHTAPENVFFEIDVYWSQHGGAPATEYFEKYPGRFTLWHVKDVKEIGASGTMDFQSIYEKAELAGLKYAIVEIEAYDLPPYEGVAASFNFLQEAPYVRTSYAK